MTTIKQLDKLKFNQQSQIHKHPITGKSIYGVKLETGSRVRIGDYYAHKKGIWKAAYKEFAYVPELVFCVRQNW